MPDYRSPGVYVEEVPSSVKAIAGVSTSIPGFIGVVPDQINTPFNAVTEEKIGTGNGTDTVFNLDTKRYPVVTTAGTFQIRVNGAPVESATLTNDDTNKVSKVTLPTAPANGATITGDFRPLFKPIEAGVVRLCTNFTQFKTLFGDFSTDQQHNYLVHAVYGFFNNGGSSCYVVRIKDPGTDLDKALGAFATIDPISLVAMPGITTGKDPSSTNDSITDGIRDKIVAHCKNTGDRFAILDGPSDATDLTNLTKIVASGGLSPKRNDYAAWYFPWITVFDPVSNGTLAVPPSGHIAGIYARVDNERGVHKAPANEAIVGALNVTRPLSKADQDNLNLQGVNCIRVLNNNILVWGARTIGGDQNADLKYINVRRTLLFLRESIDEGTQWAVFEPNTPALWLKITRNVSAFLTNVWRSGALFGATPQEAFYVKCDAETNPPELRELGQVVTEIGVAIVRPAEFVIFRISQMASK